MITLGTSFALIGAGIAVGAAALSAIGQGMAAAAGGAAVAQDKHFFGKGLLFSVLPETQAIYGLLVAIMILAFSGLATSHTVEIGTGLACIGAGLSVGLAGLSAIGQGIAAAGSIGAVSEKPDLFGKGLVFSVLPETQAIYGLLVAVLIMVFSGLMTATSQGGIGAGLACIGAGISVGAAGLSGIGQGIAASGAVSAAGRNEEMFGKGLVFSVLPETQAIYGLLVAVLILSFSGLIGTVKGAISPEVGIGTIGAGISTGLAGLSGIGQGLSARGAIATTCEDETNFGRGLVFSVLPETQAIYGLLIAVLILVVVGLFAL